MMKECKLNDNNINRMTKRYNLINIESKYCESTNVFNYDVPSQPSVRFTITIRGSSRQSVCKHMWELKLDAMAILCLRV